MKSLKIMVCYSFDTKIEKEFTDNIHIKFGAGNYRSKNMDMDETCGINIQ